MALFYAACDRSFLNIFLLDRFRFNWVFGLRFGHSGIGPGCPQSALKGSRVRRPSCIRNLPFQKKALPQGKDDKYRGTTNLPPDQCRGHFPITPGRGNHSISVAAPLTDTFAVFRPPCFTTPWLSLDFPTGTPSGHRFDDSYSNGLCSNRNVFEM